MRESLISLDINPINNITLTPSIASSIDNFSKDTVAISPSLSQVQPSITENKEDDITYQGFRFPKEMVSRAFKDARNEYEIGLPEELNRSREELSTLSRNQVEII